MTRTPSSVDSILRDPLWLPEPESGRPIVAFLSNNVPIELIHAAGCAPLQLPTAPRPTPRADRYMEDRFDPCARVALERLLAGELTSVQLLVLPRSVDSLQRLYYYLCELRRSFGESLPEPVLYDLLQAPYYTSAEYTHARTCELAERLSALAGRRLDEGALSASIRTYNQVRAVLAAVVARRCAVPAELTGVTAHALFSAAQRMLPEAFLALAERLLAALPEPAPGVRTLLIGSGHDTPALHRLIARAGGQVVCDHHVRGELSLGPAIDEALPPLRAIASHYQRESVGPRSFSTHVEAVVRAATQAHAEAAIFYYHAAEEALTWQQPAQRRALEALGLPTLRLGAQPHQVDEALLSRLRDFFETARRSSHTHTAQGEAVEES